MKRSMAMRGSVAKALRRPLSSVVTAAPRMEARSLALTGAELGAVSGANEAQAEMKKP